MRGGGDGSCRFVANSARGGSGGDVRELEARELVSHPRCAGRGAGEFGGSAGDIAPAGSLTIHGGNGGLFSGGGGGATADFGTQSGDGGNGGFGAGGGSAAVTRAGFGTSGEGGFGGGSGASDPNFVLSSAGAGAGGGAGLGGAVAVLDGELIIEDCLFDNNQALGGAGGYTDQNQDVGQGESGMGFGNDVFTLRAHPELDDPDIAIESCEELTSGTMISCAL